MKYEITIHIHDLAGGFPGSIDRLRAYLQSPELVRSVPRSLRARFVRDLEAAGLEIPAEELPEAILEREGNLGSTVNADPNEPISEVDGADSKGWLRTGFRVDRGIPVLGQHQIKAMLQQAAEAIFESDRLAKPRLSQISLAIKFCLRITPRLIPLTITGELRQERISQIIEHPRNPAIRVPSNRERDVISEAECTFTASTMESSVGKRIDESTLRSLMQAGGEFVGLGTDRGYDFGRFELVNFTKLTEKA